MEKANTNPYNEDRYDITSTGAHGTEYQVKLFMLFAERGLFKKYQFKLANKMKAAGKFDHIIFIYEHKGQKLGRFLQCKHAENTAKQKYITAEDLITQKEKGNSSLLVYFLSYLEMKKVFINIKIKDLILCCNFGFKFEGSFLNEGIFNSKDDTILPEKVFQFKDKFIGRDNIIKQLKHGFNQKFPIPASDCDIIVEIDEFLGKLLFAVNQPSTTTLNEIIKSDICKCKGISSIESDFIFSQFQTDVQYTIDKNSGQYYFRENCKLFFKKAIAEFELQGLNTAYYTKIQAIGISFDDNDNLFKEGIYKFLTSDEKVLNIVSPHKSIITAIKLYQTLNYDKFYDNFKCTFAGLHSILKMDDKVVQIFRSQTQSSNSVLVIMCESYQDEREKNMLFSEYFKFKSILEQTDNKTKFILISQDHLTMNNCKKESFSQIDDHNINITIATLNKLIQNTEVIFQGRSVKFSQLANSDLNSVINDSVTLSNIICKTPISIGSDLNYLGDSKYYYIKRAICKRVMFDHNTFFKEIIDIPDIFVVSSDEYFLDNFFKENDYPANLKIILKGNLNMEFKNMCNQCDGKAVHCMKVIGNKFKWQESQGALSNIRKFIIQNEVEMYTPKTIMDIPDNFVIIAAEPGMGKSTFFTHLAYETKKCFPELWVVLITLDDHAERFNQANIDFSIKDNAVDFLVSIVGLTNPFEKCFFKHCVDHVNKIALLFDGFDEICPNYKEKVLQLLQTLKCTMISKIWLSTRSHLQNVVEHQLSIFSFNLEPFTNNDQEIFLKRFYQNCFSNISIPQIQFNRIISQLIKCFDKSKINDSNNASLACIPLQLQMLAQALQPEVIHILENNYCEIGLQFNPNFFELFLKLISKKYDLYCTGKKRAVLSIASVQDDSEILELTFKENHSLAALIALFLDKNVKQLLSKDETKKFDLFISKVRDGREKTGFVKDIVNGIPVFVHYTFTVYFAAIWIAEKLEDRLNVQEFIRKLMYEEPGDFFFYFLDNCLLTIRRN